MKHPKVDYSDEAYLKDMKKSDLIALVLLWQERLTFYRRVRSYGYHGDNEPYWKHAYEYERKKCMTLEAQINALRYDYISEREANRKQTLKDAGDVQPNPSN